MDHKIVLLKKIENKTADIGIIGLGYVGLPLALRFLEAGFPVLGMDIDPDKTASLMPVKSTPPCRILWFSGPQMC